jgi:hypothetical protein
MLQQVSLQTQKISPVRLQRIGGQSAFNPQLAEIPFKQRIQQWCRWFSHGGRGMNYSQLASSVQ